MALSVVKLALAILLQLDLCFCVVEMEAVIEDRELDAMRGNVQRKYITVMPGTAKETVLGQFGRNLAKTHVEYSIKDHQGYFDIMEDGRLFLTKEMDKPVGFRFKLLTINAKSHTPPWSMRYFLGILVDVSSNISLSILAEPPLPTNAIYDASSAIPESGNFSFSLTQTSPKTEKEFLQIDNQSGQVRLRLPAFHSRSDCKMLSIPDYVTANILLRDQDTFSVVKAVNIRINFKRIGPPTNISIVARSDVEYSLCLNHPSSSEALSIISGYFIRFYCNEELISAEWFSVENRTLDKAERTCFDGTTFTPTGRELEVVVSAIDYAGNEGMTSGKLIFLADRDSDLKAVVTRSGDFHLCWETLENVRSTFKYIVNIVGERTIRKYRPSALKQQAELDLPSEHSNFHQDWTCVRFSAKPNVPHEVALVVIDGEDDSIQTKIDEEGLVWNNKSLRLSQYDPKKAEEIVWGFIKIKVPSPVDLEAVVSTKGGKYICFENLNRSETPHAYLVEVVNGGNFSARYDRSQLIFQHHLNATGLKPWSNLNRQCVAFNADWEISYRLIVKIVKPDYSSILTQSIETDLSWSDGCSGDECSPGICLYDNNLCSDRVCLCRETYYTFNCPRSSVCEKVKDAIGCDPVSWPETFSSTTARIPCPSGVPGQEAVRECLPTGEWGRVHAPPNCSNMVRRTGRDDACVKMVEGKIVRLRDVILEQLRYPHSKGPQEMGDVISGVDEITESLRLLRSVNGTLLASLSALPTLIERNFDNMTLQNQTFSMSKRYISAVVLDVGNQTADLLLDVNLTRNEERVEAGEMLIEQVNFPRGFVDTLLARDSAARFTLVYYRSSATFTLPDSVSKDSGVLSMSFPRVEVRNLSEDVTFTVTGHRSDPNLTPRCAFISQDGSLVSEGMKTAIVSERPSGWIKVQCSTNHLTSFSVVFEPVSGSLGTLHDRILTVISLVLTFLSVAGLAITIFFYTFFRMLSQDNQGRLLVQFCCSLLLMYLMFMLSHLTPSPIQASVTPVCAATAVMIHYLVLSSLFWMMIEAINIYQLLIEVFASQRTWFLRKRLLFCWGVPMIMVGITVSADYNKYLSAVNTETCILTAQQPLIYYLSFFVPGCAVLLFNSVVFVLVMRVVLRQRRTTRAGPQTCKTTSKQVSGVLTVMALLGIGWILGALQVGHARVFFAYLFVLVNGCQGIVVFLMRCFFYPPARLSWQRLIGRSILVRKDTVLTSDQELMRTFETNMKSSNSYRSYNSSGAALSSRT